MSDPIITTRLADLTPPAAEWDWSRVTAWLGLVLGSVCVWAVLIVLVTQTAF